MTHSPICTACGGPIAEAHAPSTKSGHVDMHLDPRDCVRVLRRRIDTLEAAAPGPIESGDDPGMG